MAFGLNRSAISRAIEVCKAISQGDFEARIVNITEKGAMGELLHAINQMIDRTDAYIRESKACLDYVARNQHFRLISEKGMVGDFLIAARTINSATYQIKQKHDGFCNMGENFNKTLGEIVGDVSEMIGALKLSSTELSDASKYAQEQALSVASGSEEVSVNMQTVAAATEELTASIAEINSQVVSSTDVAKESVLKSNEISADINNLAQASEQIGNVVSLISDITAQTNLLALNATIEAARAGDSGKGFAVVAQEVKKLASQTAQATEQITLQISSLQSSTDRAVIASKQISATIEKVSNISVSIAAAVEEQSLATQEIAVNVDQAAKGASEMSSGIASVNETTIITGNSAAEVFTVSNSLSEQESKLGLLRKNLSEFIEEVKRVG